MLFGWEWESKYHAWLPSIKTHGTYSKKACQPVPALFHKLKRMAPSYCWNVEAWHWSLVRLKLKELIAVGSKGTTSSLTRALRAREICIELGRWKRCHSLRKPYRRNQWESWREVSRQCASNPHLKGKSSTEGFIVSIS